MKLNVALLLAVGIALQEHAVPPEDPASPVHPRKFGSPGGIGETRGWYFWESFDAETWKAVVRHGEKGERYTVRVLPWATTYRHLTYGAHPDELFPGERVNLFFNHEGDVKRAYLVHFQDEIGQMKGHGHFWQVEEVDGRSFTARGMSKEKPLDPAAARFTLDEGCAIWRGGKQVKDLTVAKGDAIYLTWCADGDRRVVKLLADGASLDALREESAKKTRERLEKEGLAGFIEGETTLLVFATFWSQAAELKPGRKLLLKGTDARLCATGDGIEAKVASRKNLGAYGSGATEVVLEGAPAETVRGWTGGKVVRAFLR
jgi:hypothetical protein